jgi:hypothetical protein
MRLRISTNNDGAKGAWIEKPFKPQKYCRYGFSWICATVSSSLSLSLCLMMTAPITSCASFAGRPVLALKL